MVLDGRWPYLSFRFLLVWHVLHDFVSDQVECVLGAASSGDTIILRTFGVALELSFCHLCTLRMCHQRV
jgi:hypothetical protein